MPHLEKVVQARMRSFLPDVVLSANMPLDAQRVILKTAHEIEARFVFWLQDVLSVGLKFALRKKRIPGAGLVSRYYAHLERKLLINSDAIVCIAPDFRRLLECWRIPIAKTFVIENWAPLEEVVPMSRFNPWAKEMGLPMGNLEAAALLLAGAIVRTIDVGIVRGPSMDSRFFILWCGVGLDAAITRDVEPQREMKRRLGASMFWLVGIRDAWGYRGKRATLRFEDKRVRRRVILALAANSQLYGGIVRIAPHAKVDDGHLNLVVFKGTGFVATALHLVRVFLGAHLRDPQVEVYHTTCVTIEGKNLPVHVDAEPVGFTPVEIRVHPRSLRIMVPRSANQNLFA